MRFTVFGPIEVISGEVRRTLSRAQARGLFGLLLLEAGRPLSIIAIEDALWAGAAPRTARAQVHSAISSLRTLLAEVGGAGLLAAGTFGYRLDVPPDQVDVHLFDDRVRQAKAASDPVESARLLRSALELWRGEPLAGASGAYVAEARVTLAERRLAAIEALADAELSLGRSADVAAELHGWVIAHPLREQLRARLLLALFRSGRQAEALRDFQAYRRMLADSEGLDPGAELTRVADAILRGEAVPPDDVVAQPRIPRQLPPDVAGFVGRRAELDRLEAVTAPDATAIVAISGPGGVGKTALAVHWAHHHSDRFPDGQLYLNLHGFDPAGTAMAAGEALRRLLEGIGVPAPQIPSEVDSQVSLYRTTMAGRRMLVVLDNARDADQVRPLLPGAPGCAVLVTSRTSLASLVAAEGAAALSLGMLSRDEAHDLLARRLGADAPRDGFDEIITHCARLPLALAIVAANATVHPRQTLAAVAAQLRDSRLRLDLLSTNDASVTDVRAVFSWSYRTLGSAAARLFRLLGRHPGPDISVAAAASLAALSPAEVLGPLTDLTGAHLVEEHAPGRFRLHDLLRAYAAELAEAGEARARNRLLDHYLHTAFAGDRLLNPHREPITPGDAEPGVTPEPLSDREQALQWFAAERPVLLSVVDHAAAGGDERRTWQLGWSLFHFLDGQGHWHDHIGVQQATAAAAERLGDPAVQILAQRLLARAYIQLSRFGEAQDGLRHALDLAVRAGDRTAQANIHNSLGHLEDRQGRHTEALDQAQQALDLFRATGDVHGQANTLNAVGWCHAMLGGYAHAIANCEESLRLCQQIEDRYGESHALDSLGYIHRRRGEFDPAVKCYEQAIDIARGLGARRIEADFLISLADAHHDAGNLEAARDAWGEALAILEELQDPGADRIRAKLAV